MTDDLHWRHALYILLAATAVRFFLAGSVPLFPDEAYYWDWSRHLALGYFDHPPMIAWLIAGGTTVFGDTPFGVRVLPNLAGTVAGFAVARTAYQLAGGTAARYAAATIVLMPIGAVGFVLATPDAPLLAAIAGTLYFVVRALDVDPGSPEFTRNWLAAGACIGLAMLSKFTGVFVPMAVALAFALRPSLRPYLKMRGPWLAVGVATLLVLPMLYWNATHEWLAFRFQLTHGLGGGPRNQWWQRLLDLVGGQAGLITPILFVLFVAAIRRAFTPSGGQQRFVLAVVAVFCLGFFTFSALRKPVEANWPAIGWLPVIVLLAATRAGMRSPWERRGLWLAGGLTAIIVAHVLVPFLPIAPQRDPVLRAFGWRKVAAEVAAFTEANAPDSASVYFAAPRYQTAALLGFHLRGHPNAYAVNILTRRNQYDLWPNFPDVAERLSTLVFLSHDTLPRSPVVDSLLPHFGSMLVGPIVYATRGADTIAARRIWVLGYWQGTWPDDPNRPLRPTAAARYREASASLSTP